jgi:hypothetical protein
VPTPVEARAGEAPADEAPDASPVPDVGGADPPDAPVAPGGFVDDAVAFDIARHGIDVVVVPVGEVVEVVDEDDVDVVVEVVEVVDDDVVEVVEVGVDDVVVDEGVVEVVVDDVVVEEVLSHGPGDAVEVVDVVEEVSLTVAPHAAAGSNPATAPTSVTARTRYRDRHRCTALLSSVEGRFQ